MIHVTQNTQPTLTIVSLDDFKNYIKVDSSISNENALMTNLIKSSQKTIERKLNGFTLIETNYTQKIVSLDKTIKNIELQHYPLIGVPTVSYYDDFSDNTSSNITYSDYFKVIDNNLYHKNNYFDSGRYEITFLAGKYNHDNIDNIDYDLYVAVLRLASFYYENREQYVTSINEDGALVLGYDFKKDHLDINHLIYNYFNGQDLI